MGLELAPIVVQLHGAGVNVGLQVIVVVGQRRHLVNRGHAMPHALKLHFQKNIDENVVGRAGEESMS